MVDTWEMVVVHRAWRREFGLFGGLVRGVPAGDVRRAAVVAEHIDDFVGYLHHHHSGEDELLWPLLLTRIVPRAELVRRMAAQHDELAMLLGRLSSLVRTWRGLADPLVRDQLAAVADEASVALDKHLAEEETEILPLVAVHVTEPEWQALGEHGKGGIPKGGKGFVLLGAILEDATPDERVAFLGFVPAPVRLAWRLFGAGVHRRAMERVRGA